MTELLELAKAIVVDESGIKLLLLMLAGVSIWAYWREKKKGEAVAEERLIEAREDTEQIMGALAEAHNTIKDFKASNDALKYAFESLEKAVDRQLPRRGSE